ncbi:MAG: 16S rRNA (cytosine(967)-C(5))-methyltransferase RsmB [Planctomycetes bacterium]|nr:16S rRNA (cytosine(967)-C(5))-methyltransferase RsmB [Planctomycetota bacterium]
MADVRLEALRILGRIEKGRDFAQDLIAEVITESALDRRDASLLAEIVYGVVRHRLTLDSIVSAFSKTPLRRLDAKCLHILRMGTYQIVFLDRIPDRAAVDESVKLAPQARLSSAKGFINAVLRSTLRGVVAPRSDAPGEPRASIYIRENTWAVFRRFVLPDPGDRPAHLAAAYSHPQWLVERWLPRLGEEKTASFLRANNDTPPLTVRVNRMKTDRAGLLHRLEAEGAQAAEGELPLSVRLGPGTRIPALPSFREGLFQVQDETSMRVSELLDPQPGESVLDLCAAPGGKTTGLAERMGDKGMVVAVDRSAPRLCRVRENLDRLGLRCVQCLAADGARRWWREGCAFDRVLVDVPCSNTGVLARRVEARWRLRPEDIAELADLQKKLLLTAAKTLRPGGVLAYSTCSIEEASRW